MHLLKITSEVHTAVSTAARDASRSTFTATGQTVGSQTANYRAFRLPGEVVVNVFLTKLKADVRVHKLTSVRSVLETTLDRRHIFSKNMRTFFTLSYLKLIF